jgi:hypothetical protein
MHNFLLDIWHDLRAKRLWPIAALLMVAIAAVPFVLLEKSKPTAPPAPAATTQAQPAADKLPSVTLDEIAAGAPSDLTEFAQRNPFKPLKDIPKGDDTNVTVTRGTSDAAKTDSGSSTTSGGSSTGGAKAGSGSGSSTGGYVGPRTTYYQVRADISFGEPGKEKTIEQVENFTLLGDDKDPAALYMGLTNDGKYAVFTVDSAKYEANGEHVCKPSEDSCDFIYLSTDEDGNETNLSTPDGLKTFNLKVLAINKVKVDEKDVVSVPSEDAKSPKSTADRPNTVDLEPRSLFDILVQTR